MKRTAKARTARPLANRTAIYVQLYAAALAGVAAARDTEHAGDVVVRAADIADLAFAQLEHDGAPAFAADDRQTVA
jgi:hypothetical protein